MSDPQPTISLAIETTCRLGGVALGVGDALRTAIEFDASQRHATHLVTRLQELLRSADLRPADVDELYVSVGPGSFTGTRVGVTVARTMGRALPGLRLVAVPSPAAVAENLRDIPWSHLAVVLDAKEDAVHATLFARTPDGGIVPDGEPRVIRVPELLASAPKPLLVTGEGAGYHDLTGEGVTLAPDDTRLPRPEGVWRVGRRMAAAGQFTDALHLLPTYVRPPEAVRLWEKRPQTPS